MRIQATKPFQEDYEGLPETIRDRVDKQIAFLMEDPHHPSLRTKKIKGHPNIWEGRVTGGYRFTFQISGDLYILRRVGTHEMLKSP